MNAAQIETLELATLTSGEKALPLSKVKLRGRVTGLDAEVTLTQEYTNTYETHLEVTYVFPLPARYAVKSLTATLGGRKVHASLQERAAARQVYQQAINEGKRAALAEEERSDVFTLTVGNIAPGEIAVIELSLVGRLSVDHLEATFRFPTVVAPRYTPSAKTLAPSGTGTAKDNVIVPDASRLTPPRSKHATPKLDFEVSFDRRMLNGALLTSALHKVEHEVNDDQEIIRFKTDEKLDRDIILRYPLAVGTTSLTLTPDAEGPEGTWSLQVVSKPKRSRKPRKVVLVLDRSGSMGGWKMVAARRAAARIVDSLTDEDSFEVIAFDHEVQTDGPATLRQGSDEKRFKATRWLSQLEARGGTEMKKPLVDALRLLEGAPNSFLVLVTDGQVTSETQLLAELATHQGDTRIMSVGIDRAVNAGFLESLSRSSGGASFLIESEERLTESMAHLTRVINTPRLTDVTVVADGVEILDETTPQLHADAFGGVPLTIRGRYKGDPSAAVFSMVATKKFRTVSEDLRAEVKASPARSLWARELINDLSDQYSAHPSEKLEKRIVKISLENSVLSRFTAFVAVDDERQEVKGSTEVAQPVLSPSGWAAAAMPRAGSARAGGQILASAATVMPMNAASPAFASDASIGFAPSFGTTISRSQLDDAIIMKAESKPAPVVSAVSVKELKKIQAALQAGDKVALKLLVAKLVKAQELPLLVAALNSYLQTLNEADRQLALVMVENLLNRPI